MPAKVDRISGKSPPRPIRDRYARDRLSLSTNSRLAQTRATLEHGQVELHRLLRSAILVAFLGIEGAGCSTGTGPSDALNFGPDASRARISAGAAFPNTILPLATPKIGRSYTLVREARTPGNGTIWASAFGNDPSSSGFVNYYSLKGHRQVPLGQLSGSLDGPEGMATDRSGNLYVVNTIDDNTLEYEAGATSPERTLADLKGYAPGEVALGPDGTVYVTNIHGPLPKNCGTFCIPKPGNIVAYAHASTKPTTVYKTFPATNAYYPIGIGVDAQNDIFVTYETTAVSGGKGGVVEFVAGAMTPVDTGIVLGYAGGVGFDAAENLIVSDLLCPCIGVYPPGSKTPSRELVKTGTPVTFAFGKSGRFIYVANGVNLDLEVYDYTSDRLVDRISGGGFTSSTSPTGIAVWPRL